MGNINTLELIKHLSHFDMKTLSIIQHGSTSMNISYLNSDIDLLVIIEEKEEFEISEKVFLDTANNKVHLKIVSIKTFKSILKNFQNDILSKNLDLNILSGRIFMGEIIYTDIDIQKVINKYKNNINFNIIALKFLYQAYNFLNDAKHPNNYIKQNCIEKAIDSLMTSILIKNKVTTLNIKWQPLIIKEFLPKELYEDYLSLRFNYKSLNLNEINNKIKVIICYIKELLK